MRIGINLLSLIPGKIGGMEQYIRNLLGYASRENDGHTYFLFLNKQYAHTFDAGMKCIRVVTMDTDEIYDTIARTVRLNQWIDGYAIDLWFCPLLELEPANPVIPSVVTLPDVQHEIFPEFFAYEVLHWRKKSFRYAAYRADAIITLSEYSKMAIEQTCGAPGHKVHAIYLDASKECSEWNEHEKLSIAQKYNLPEFYAYYPANTWPHKNHLHLLLALLILRDVHGIRLQLICSGNENEWKDTIANFIAEHGLQEQVRFLGYVPQEDIPYLYLNAQFLVFPSFYEGFGVPLVEAMRTGTPIVCASAGSIPEVVGDAGLLFDPGNPEHIAGRILSMLDSGTRRTLADRGIERARNFSWKTCYTRTINLFNALVQEGRCTKRMPYGKRKSGQNINAYEKCLRSQDGEDGIIAEVFARIGTTNRFFVEFGVESGKACNTAHLALDRVWSGVMIEGNEAMFADLEARYSHLDAVRTLHRFITKDNIADIFREMDVPESLDLLSIDIDGNDYWVWAALEHYKPRLVVIEYNAAYPPPQKMVIVYDPDFVWDGTTYYGASLTSLQALGNKLGYSLIGTDARGVNAFFLRKDLLRQSGFPELTPEEAYHPPSYGLHNGGHPWREGPFLEI